MFVLIEPDYILSSLYLQVPIHAFLVFPCVRSVRVLQRSAQLVTMGEDYLVKESVMKEHPAGGDSSPLQAMSL